ncbi:hypothetical protein MC3_06980 [Rickettsia slovaca str. D-CWPP]|uniref:Uncharacterized protein n=2 Tax=spotted fever group TaxID=114277 RepID=H8LLX5_RICSL|nr:hypothetical protein RSA_06925 [Rickettsia philipii str. 364D]AFD20241.1 hypothetical protein MC3_06980 [Rickettsia slovaca str. D-CWPP]
MEVLRVITVRQQVAQATIVQFSVRMYTVHQRLLVVRVVPVAQVIIVLLQPVLLLLIAVTLQHKGAVLVWEVQLKAV